MLTIQIEDELEAKLIGMAKRNHLSPEQVIKQLITDYTRPKTNKPVLVSNAIKDLPTIDAFKGDPMDIQRAMRNEWD